jgi:hypothetical protein
MLYNFVCINFYKEIQTYVSENHFEEHVDTVVGSQKDNGLPF